MSIFTIPVKITRDDYYEEGETAWHAGSADRFVDKYIITRH
jgi:hypothetical protein